MDSKPKLETPPTKSSTPLQKFKTMFGAWTPSGEVFVGVPTSYEKRWLARTAPDTVDKSPVRQPQSSSGNPKPILRLFSPHSTATPSRIPVRRSVVDSAAKHTDSSSTIGQSKNLDRVNKNLSSSQQSSSTGKVQLSESFGYQSSSSDSTIDREIEEKQRMLETLRAKKAELESKLRSSARSKAIRKNGNTDCGGSVPVGESVLESTVVEENSQIEEAQRLTQHSTVILQNLARLSAKELDKLTSINTNSNRQYVKQLVYSDIYKDGPRPQSPNAKTLSKFAAESRSTDTSDSQENIPQENGRVVWAAPEKLVQIMDRKGRRSKLASETLKSCLNKKCPAALAPLSLSQSPVRIQRFIYEDDLPPPPPPPAPKTTKKVTLRNSIGGRKKKPPVQKVKLTAVRR